MKLVVVEDSAILRRMVVQRLEDEVGATTVGQADGESTALTTVKLTSPDAVLVDLNLASGSGLALVSRLRAHRFRGRLIVLSSNDREAYEPMVLARGADRFYDKSNDFEGLLRGLGNPAGSLWMGMGD
ncbi:MAG: response regulator transcription factor [Rubrivivax sp.]|nr:MAG: response regulator transcription factor [Rubrivivax sp.]